jgi:NAD(P)-dependent dehydrogenase (short-subunit alcohol dehydrogenase family)
MSINLSLSGQTALVTGAGTGIGFGIARRLLQAGATVTIVGRRQDVIENAARALDPDVGAGAEVRWKCCDVTVEDDVAAAVAAAADRDGHLDIAVANAGSGSPGPILAQTPDTWRHSFDVNVVGSAMTIKHAALAMKDSGGGSIVTISSQSAVRSALFMAPYTVSKAGLDALVRCAALELAPFGIRVNGLRPGLVMSEGVTMAFDDEMYNAAVSRTLLGRPGEAEEIGDSVLYLVSQLSRWVTGQVYGVCGGLSVSDHDDFSSLCRRIYGEEQFEALTGRPAEKR